MGSQVVSAVETAPDLELVCAIDLGDELRKVVDADADVAVDFTNPTVAMANIEFLVANGVHCVVGTSGFDADKIELLGNALVNSPEVGGLIAPNFGVAAVLVMMFSAKAAPYFESVEILELHHPDKVDAPSGTATRTAELVGEARSAAKCDPMPDATAEAANAARGLEVAGVPIHSARIRGMIAHQEVVFGTAGELLTIRHDSMNRESFMPGVLLGIRGIVGRPGLTVGLENFLDI